MSRHPPLAILPLTPALLPGGGEGGGQGGGESPKATAPFSGVITAEPLPGAAELQRLGQGGVGTLRINLAWGSVQSGPDASYDWSHYDPVVRSAAENGVRIL